ncbi:Gfo/Idh/MocA family oxidoreductase [Compostibacter hankyongensis]|uniref:Gfo/Idh/MocA family oxidoreductase n=1 Tax=Compostibacter hankyongensis TaxID=1007089 RepID=A0ABP8FR43_9BACT
MKELSIGIVGYKFMGRAHSNGWKKAPLFFDLPFKPVLKAVCGRNEAALNEFARKWGWQETETSWRKMVERPDIDVIDIAAPQHLHYDIAIAAAKNGKHVFCEKPLAMSSAQAEEMLEACEQNRVHHFLNHNYRRVPAISLAKKLIDTKKIGQIYHWRCCYQQDWVMDPNFPLTWQLQQEFAQSGPQWDLNSHCVDMALYLIGKITAVSALTGHFITERPLAEEATSHNLKVRAKSIESGKVTVEDAALMMVRFENGAMGSFEATRFAMGRKNRLSFEIYGSSGAITFDLERMNELRYYSAEDDQDTKGFKTILATAESHKYMDHWWPEGHIIGYEHTFVHAMADFLTSLKEDEMISPNFTDGIQGLKVLEAGIRSAQTGNVISII